MYTNFFLFIYWEEGRVGGGEGGRSVGGGGGGRGGRQKIFLARQLIAGQSASQFAHL